MNEPRLPRFRIQILVAPETEPCGGLGIQVRLDAGAEATYHAGSDLVFNTEGAKKTPFVQAFNYSEKDKKLAPRHLALLILLALAREAPERAAELGFPPRNDGSISFPHLARLSFFDNYEQALHKEERRLDFRKDVTTHFKSGSTRGIVVKRDPWTIALHLPDTELVFEEGAADTAVTWLQSELDRGAAPERSGEPIASMEHFPHLHHPVFGRSAELATLTEAYEAPGTRIALVVGWGGVGKSTLVSRWAEPPPAGCERVFGWSFTTQGTHERCAASADLFIDEALRFFGDTSPRKASPVERGKRLATLVQQRRTVLLLDGLEPLQDPIDGTIRDPALATLLHELAARMNGLCVVTTRPPFTALAGHEGRSVMRVDLDRLSDEAGAELLRSLGIQGSEPELWATSREQRGHALTLTLLGTFLFEARKGDVRLRSQASLDAKETREGRHAWRVIEDYDAWFGPGPAQAVLRLAGLFDRPAPASAIRALRRAPAISGVTDRIVGLDEDEWNRCLTRLRRARLLLDDGGDGSLDAHPLVRELLGLKLGKENPAGFRAAHGRLFEHLRDEGKPSPDGPEDTLEELEPLFQAIWHGHHAGRLQEAFDLYRGRLRRNNLHFSLYHLNALSSDLAAQSAFFDPTGALRPSLLTGPDEGWLLSARAFSLRALGDVERASAALIEATRVHAEQGSFMDASVAKGNLAEMSTLLGDIRGAARHCEEEIAFAERSGVPFMCRLTLGHRAHLLHLQGRLQDASRALGDARATTASCPPDYPLLALYDDVVFTWWSWEMTLDVAESAPLADWPALQPEPPWPVGRAFIQLVRGRLAAASGQQEVSDMHFAEAITLLRDAGERTWLATGLIARAADAARSPYLPPPGRAGDAGADLEEALSIAREGRLLLLQCDALLSRARFAARRGAPEQAESDLAAALKLVRRTGYLVREADGDLVSAWIAVARDEAEPAAAAVAKARERIERIGYGSRRGELAVLEQLISGLAGAARRR